jgi:iron(III) transport system substrate-binding protein
MARDILGGICDHRRGQLLLRRADALRKEGPSGEVGRTSIKVDAARPSPMERRHPRQHQRRLGREERAEPANAVKLLEFLVSEPAQAFYAETNYEYPVRKGVALDSIIASSIGELKVDPLPITEIAKYRKQASALVDKVGFDQ